MANYAYLRVSTDSQELASQKLGIMEYANTRGLVPLKVVKDTTSGKWEWRDRLIGEVIESAKKGDVIVVAEVSRLARSTLQVLEILKVCAERGVSVHIAKNALVMDGSMQATITATILGLAAEIEREFISQRTKEGLARVKLEGKKLGRKKGYRLKRVKLDNHKENIQKWLDMGLSKSAIAKLCGVTRATLYNYLKRGEIKY